MKIMMYVAIFILIMAVLSIVLFQNGETKDYLSFRAAISVITNRLDYDLVLIKTGSEALNWAFETSESLLMEDLKEFISTYTPYIPESNEDGSTDYLDWFVFLGRLFIGFFQYIGTIMGTGALCLFCLVFMLLCYIGEGIRFVAALISVIWSFLDPTYIPTP